MTENRATAEPFRVVVFADFVCPYSFLAVDQIDRLAREYDVQPLWRPHWLHPETPPEGSAARRRPSRRDARAAPRVDQGDGAGAIPAHPHSRRSASTASTRSRRSSSPTTAASTSRSRRRVYDLMWTEGGDIGEPETLMAAAERVGTRSRTS